MNAIIITVGDEILIGQVIDTNSAWIGSTFNNYGIDIKEILSVSDDLESIENAIRSSLKKADIVVMTGGLGPTKDDITKVAICNYFKVGNTFSQVTYDRIEKIFAKFGRPMKESHKDQCFMPDNATLLMNDMGTAPGMLFIEDAKILVSLPGVPFEMKHLITDRFLPYIKENYTLESKIYHKTIMTAGEGESFIADRIAHLIADMPEYIKMAYLPSLGSVRLRLTAKHTDEILIKNKVDHYAQLICQELGSLVFGFDDQSLEETLLKIFTEKGLTLTTAESCTGGYLAHRLTSISGSSAYFLGSTVTYSNEMKMNLLKVKESTLSAHGAVSEETVKEMVMGLLTLTGSDYGISISGIAGPDGGSPEKPVGTIWIAVGNKNKIEAYKLNATKDRLRNIEYAANVAMNKLRLFIS
jgi:nicotinamide-nucleotide amidase